MAINVVVSAKNGVGHKELHWNGFKEKNFDPHKFNNLAMVTHVLLFNMMVITVYPWLSLTAFVLACWKILILVI